MGTCFVSLMGRVPQLLPPQPKFGLLRCAANLDRAFLILPIYAINVKEVGERKGDAHKSVGDSHNPLPPLVHLLIGAPISWIPFIINSMPPKKKPWTPHVEMLA